ncbi:MAG: hypothetical protein PSX81_07260 [bacterium]|nr:hypothetical protein [bacterium]
MKVYFFALLLITLSACNSQSNKQTQKESEQSSDAQVAKVNPIKIEYYPDSSLFRELNTQTLEAKIYTADGKLFLKGKYNDTTYQLNGVWEDWDRKANYKRFDLTFVNNVENGPFTSYRDNGKIYVTGAKKNGVFTDTLKFHDKDEKVFEMQVYKVDPTSKEGTKRIKTINLNAQRSDGTIEQIKGKYYLWKDGEKQEIDSDQVPAR